MEDALLEMLSAYADGELDAAASARVEAALQAEPRLRRRLAAFRALDAQAAVLPVPELDGSAAEALWTGVFERSERGAGTIRKPPPAQALESGRWRELAVGLPRVPEVSETRWGEAWSNIRGRTRTLLPSSVVERAVPLDADLSPIGMRAVSWSADGASIGGGRRAWSLWLAAGGMAAAAALMAGLTVFLLQGRSSSDPAGSQPQVAEDALEGARVLDDRYFMMVKHVTGTESEAQSPVETVCFFLK